MSNCSQKQLTQKEEELIRAMVCKNCTIDDAHFCNHRCAKGDDAIKKMRT